MQGDPKKRYSPFKTTRDGTKVFFPWWIFGTGYEIPSDALSKKIERYRRITTVLDLFVIGFTASAWRMHSPAVFRYGGILLLLALLAHYVMKVRSWTRGMKRSEVRLVTAAERRATIASQSLAKLWFALTFSLFFCAFAVLMLGIAIDTGDLGISLLAGFLALIGSAFLSGAVWAMVLRRRVLRQLEVEEPEDLG